MARYTITTDRQIITTCATCGEQFVPGDETLVERETYHHVRCPRERRSICPPAERSTAMTGRQFCPAVIVGGAISIAAIIYTWAIVAHLLT